MSITRWPFRPGTAITIGLFRRLDSVVPQGGRFGEVFVQQIPIISGPAILSATAHPVVGIR